MSAVQPPPPPSGALPPPPPQPARRPPPPRIDASLLRPSRALYWVAGAIAALSVAVSVALFVGLGESVIDELTGPLTHLDAPGAVTVELAPGAERTIFRQDRGSGVSIRASGTPDPSCAVSRVGGGEIEVSDAFGWTLKRQGDRYQALYDFEAIEGGSYRVRCSGSNGVPLAIGETIGLMRLLGQLVIALGAFFGGLAIAVTIAVVTAVMRDSHKRRLQREALEQGTIGLG